MFANNRFLSATLAVLTTTALLFVINVMVRTYARNSATNTALYQVKRQTESPTITEFPSD